MMRSGSSAAEVGLTLIEMLVVLAIVGVVSGAVSMTLSSDRGASVHAEAERLARAMQLAADDAMVSGRTATLVADRRSWSVEYPGDGRLSIPKRELPSGIELEGSSPIPRTIETGGNAIDLTLVGGSEAWLVGFDGLRAFARKAPAA